MNSDERRIMTYVGMAHGLTHIIELTYAAMLTRIAIEFGLRAVVTGAIATLFGWAFGSSAIPSGFLTDRLGSRPVLVYSFGGSAVMAVLVGLSPNEWWLAAALLGLGLTTGLYHPAGISLVAQGISQRGLGLGFHGVAGNVGQAMAPAIAIGLALLVDWRLAFFFVGGLSAVLALVLATTRFDVRPGSETVAVDAAEEAGDQSTREGNRFFLPLLLVYAAFVVSGMVYRGAITYLPKHLEDFVNDDFGGAFVTVALLTGAVGQLIGGALSQRYRLESLAPIICLLTVPPLLLTGVVSGWGLVIIASVFVFFYFAAQPLWTGLIADYSPPGAVGRSYGFSFFAGFGLGGTGGIIAGVFVDVWDTQAAFLGLGAIMTATIFIALSLWVLAERRRRAAAPAHSS
ncbi:MAG: MFS transporter [Chloroflexi bacterium]|nr:MFS transporter [Chloroflexota bacterium]MCI0814241.1 MFS transporter [Chloroflexota bacterium]MCI0817376.1 MFS transporter [Chloroflexota bacterium]MCI0819931.1 MFS transporter [Chloroflexota bacterium]MCI0832591.1 MFS transporter [Chloroflexota bacterium]